MQQQDQGAADRLSTAEIEQLRQTVREGYREIDALRARRKAAAQLPIEPPAP